MLQKSPVLFYKKEQCCGCGACLNKCPREVITMQVDENGFRYPRIDAEFCIFCGRCLEACGYQFGKVVNHPLQTFADVSKDKKFEDGEVLEVLAQQVISEGGVVFGAAFDSDGIAKHIKMDSAQALSRLQGTKCVYSDTGRTFSEAKELLTKGVTVLYAGTSCQIAGLYGYLGKYAKYDHFITIDFVCRDFSGKRRENCHPCKYEWGKRPADITIREKRGKENEIQRVSLAANSESGIAFLKRAGI